MHFSDLKYLFGCLPPFICWLGLYLGGWYSPGLLYFGFVIIPLIELFVPASTFTEDESILMKKSTKIFFDILLYLQVPMLYGIVSFFVWQYIHAGWTMAEIIFSVINLGILIGVTGINIAHELGHRKAAFDRWMARALLIPALYSHFTLEHNYGHHLKVGTPEDPATARKNEPVYTFYWRTISKGYLNAWAIEKKIFEQAGLPKWRNELIWSHLVQLIYLGVIFFFAGFGCVIALFLAALWGILFLETVNYIEHYGLVRNKLSSGRYEPMSEIHSWNSNHELGRIILFELVRHADHHYQTTRKYQTLRHLDKSPQLPFGYPMSIVLALVPRLWFSVMNPRVDALQGR
jgi:alkane 1-monooxygenase